MGVIDIRSSSVSRQNMGSVPSPQVFSNPMIGQDWAAKARVGDAVVHGAERLSKAALDVFAAIQEKEDQRQVDGANAEIQRRFNEYMLGNGKENTGVFTTFGQEENPNGEEWMRKNGEEYDKISAKVKDEMKLTERQFELAKHSLNGYQTSWMQRQSVKANEVYDRNAQARASKRLEATKENLALGGASEDAFVDWAKAKNAELDARHIHDKETREAEFRVEGLKVLQSAFARDLKILDASVATETEREKVDEAFDKARSKLLENPDLYVRNPILKAALGEEGLGKLPDVVTYEGKVVGTLDEGSGIYKAFLTDLEAHRQSALANADALKRKVINRGRDEFYKMSDATTGMTNAQKANFYRQSADRYRESDPRFYNMLIGKGELFDSKAAKEDRIADAKAQRQAAKDAKLAAKAQSDAEKKERADMKHDMMKGATILMIPPPSVTDAEARAKWEEDRRDFECEYIEAFKRGDIEPETARTIMGMMDRHYTQEEETAINTFDRLFGFDRGRYAKSSDVTQRLTYRQVAQGRTLKVKVGERPAKWYESGKTKDLEMTYEDLQSYRDVFLDEFRNAPKGVDKEKWAEECANKVKSLYVSDHAAEIVQSLKDSGTAIRTQEASRLNESQARVAALYEKRAATKAATPISPVSLIDDEPLDDDEDLFDEAEFTEGE